MNISILLALALPLATGVMLGAMYFSLLLYAVRRYAMNHSVLRVAPMTLVRLTLAVAAFLAAAQWGARPLLFVLLGFMVGRSVVQVLALPKDV
jgi:F1F0 ATPase subunit 2